ncbi:uncharacterized protein LOC133302391 [Gastrolobium bilobum]|uniref:uncharacterized protein LOC133302391 n=1 Tax=Gastrolobium bilobum TaxID=150636 RepID=UPI002AAFCA39|nr:uncharacterized protein LOC133302391 [Gastrolobium bilobum]
MCQLGGILHIWKFDKYWKEYSTVLAFGAIFALRLKLVFLDFCYTKIDPFTSQNKVKNIRENFEKLYEEYVSNLKGSSASNSHSSIKSNLLHKSSGESNRSLKGLRMKVSISTVKFANEAYLRDEHINAKQHSKKAKEKLQMAHQLSSSQQFKSANEAYLRGEHLNAKQHSMKAREKLKMARELDCKAATEILNFKNRTNGLWRLDLHGLHAKEAVQALRERLEKIESKGLSRTHFPSNKNNKENEFVDSIHAKQVGHGPTVEVITGVGKHSRGKPVLPLAVRSFLTENRYHFEDIRPGAIKVWPNFL